MNLNKLILATVFLLVACTASKAQLGEPTRLKLGRGDSLKHRILLDSLISAAQHNKVFIVQSLISRGADANGKIFLSRNAWLSPLSEAVRLNYTQVVKILVANGADPNLDLGECSTAFQTSAGGCVTPCSDSTFNLLLAKGGKVNTYSGFSGGTPLSYAINAGDVKKAKILIEAGAVLNPDSVNHFKSPLMDAVNNLNYDMVAMLLKYGANVNAKVSWPTEDCMFPCHDSTTIAYQLVEMYNYSDKQKIEKILDLALNHKLDLNAEYGQGLTALELAAAIGKNGELVDKLIERGAKLETRSNSALRCAAACSNVEMVNHLLKFKVNINRQDDAGNTPLFLSLLLINPWTGERFAKTVDLLLSHGADPTIKNKNGESFIKHVGLESRKELRKILAKYGY